MFLFAINYFFAGQWWSSCPTELQDATELWNPVEIQFYLVHLSNKLKELVRNY